MQAGLITPDLRLPSGRYRWDVERLREQINSLPVVRDGECGTIFDECEHALRALTRFKGADGSYAKFWAAKMSAKAKGWEQSWITIAAQCMVRAYEFYRDVQPRLDAELRAAIRAEEDAQERELRRREALQASGMSLEEFKAAQPAEGVARAAASLREGEALFAELGVDLAPSEPDTTKVQRAERVPPTADENLDADSLFAKMDAKLFAEIGADMFGASDSRVVDRVVEVATSPPLSHAWGGAGRDARGGGTMSLRWRLAPGRSISPGMQTHCACLPQLKSWTF